MNVMTTVVNIVMGVSVILLAAFLLLDWYIKRH